MFNKKLLIALVAIFNSSSHLYAAVPYKFEKNTAAKADEVNGNFDYLDKKISGTVQYDGWTKQTAASSCKQILQNNTAVQSGVYWLDPDGGATDNAFKAYCDMETEGGGWTLLMRINGLLSGHVKNNDSIGDTPCSPQWIECKLSRVQINLFLAQAGTKVLRILPDDLRYVPWYVSTSKQITEWPDNLEASNRSVLNGDEKFSWILTSYPTAADAFAGTNGQVGDYASANHYYPSPYNAAVGKQQFFSSPPGGGIRSTNITNAGSYSNQLFGTLWVR